jgi:hypothetical protein
MIVHALGKIKFRDYPATPHPPNSIMNNFMSSLKNTLKCITLSLRAGKT